MPKMMTPRINHQKNRSTKQDYLLQPHMKNFYRCANKDQLSKLAGVGDVFAQKEITRRNNKHK